MESIEMLLICRSILKRCIIPYLLHVTRSNSLVYDSILHTSYLLSFFFTSNIVTENDETETFHFKVEIEI